MKKFLSFFTALLLFSACHKTETPQSFADRSYILYQTPANTKITLGFESKSKRFYGESGVNRYFGNYTEQGQNLTFNPAGSTMMSGPAEQMEAEHEYLQALSKVNRFKMEGNKLYLYTTDNQELVFYEMTSLDNTDTPATNRYLKKAIEQRKEQ